MNPLVAYAWPGFAVGVVLGALVGTFVLRRRLAGARLLPWIAGAAIAATAAVGLWSGPLGGAARYTKAVEDYSRLVLIAYEMEAVQARLGREPLSRKLYLQGPGDDWQRNELALIMGNVPGVSTATWSRNERATPLLAQAVLIAFAGIALGWLLAGLLEWHRRYNAQWNW